ncbi:MAG TPA: AAA family ATPase [Verrucomicrobiota bacterium]|nr:AAA family ATPase [Verrucomicrobiota bacterium]
MLLNTATPRVFIAATRQNDGKTTNSLGLLAALQRRFGRIGYIKPVGQRFVEIDAEKIDEDSVLMDRVFRLNCPLVDMSPIAVEPDFTRRYLQSSNFDVLVKRIHKAFDRVAWEKDFVLCEGTGHAGVGSVFDLSNATVARVLNAKVVIVTRGGIGLPIDEVTLNRALFEKEGVEVIGVILNKVLPEKLDYISEFAEKGLRRKGLKLLGVVPHLPILSSPTVDLIREDLRAQVLNSSRQVHNIVDRVIIGAMSAAQATARFKRGVLLIVPADRSDIIKAAGEYLERGGHLAGIVLSDDIPPSSSVLKHAAQFSCPVLWSDSDSYTVASRVHDLIVKIRPDDTEKIKLVQELIATHVKLDKILEALEGGGRCGQGRKAVPPPQV